jgi:hypothetical protein
LVLLQNLRHHDRYSSWCNNLYEIKILPNGIFFSFFKPVFDTDDVELRGSLDIGDCKRFGVGKA